MNNDEPNLNNCERQDESPEEKVAYGQTEDEEVGRSVETWLGDEHVENEAVTADYYEIDESQTQRHGELHLKKEDEFKGQ